MTGYVVGMCSDAANGAAGEHVLEFDAREADELFWFLSGEGSCALGVDGIDRLYDLLSERDRLASPRWVFSESERQEMLEEMGLQDCSEMTDEMVFTRLKAALLALAG